MSSSFGASSGSFGSTRSQRPSGRAWLLAALVLLAASHHAAAQRVPDRVIRIVAVESGGGADFNARLIQQALIEGSGANVIVDNRRNTIVAAQTAAKATPNGATLFAVGSSFWLLPYLQENVPFDPVKDFSPVSMTNQAPNVLVVNPALPVSSVKDLIALAKAKPGGLNYSTGASGASSHLAPELFKVATSTNMVRIPFKGAGPAMTALISGEVQLMFASAGAATPHIKSGRVKALAVASLAPSTLFPGLPTIASSGVPGYESGSQQGIFAPANTPASVVSDLHRMILRYLEQPEVKQKFLSYGVEPVGNTPKQFSDIIRADMAKWRKLIRQLGLRSDQ